MTQLLPKLTNANDFLPTRINTGNFVSYYSLPELIQRVEHTRVVLPLCSLGTPASELTQLGELVLPPLYYEAMEMAVDLKPAILARIEQCFPYFGSDRRQSTSKCQIKVVELPRRKALRDPQSSMVQVRAADQFIVAFSVDTAVEQHGPHLPLATDTIQSYAVLNRLTHEFPELVLLPPVDYGQLTWGLPFGMSVDISAALLVRYVTGFVNAVHQWLRPAAIFVVDVHGSIIHRTAIQDGLAASSCPHWSFRWLYDPLVPYSGQRGDQHAGGVETAIVEAIHPALVDASWWPSLLGELADKQMPVSDAISLSANLQEFRAQVERQQLNGIVGNIHNYAHVNGVEMLNSMVNVARADLLQLRQRLSSTHRDLDAVN